MSALQDTFAPLEEMELILEVVPAPAPTPQQVVLQAGMAYIVSACLNVVMKLRIPDLIGDGTQPVQVLAYRAGVDTDYLCRVLRVLETAGLMHREGEQSFALTEAGLLLRSGVEGSLAAASEWLTDPLHLQVYSQLLGSVTMGETAFDHMHDKPFFDWISQPENADEARVFNNAMTSISEMCVPAFLEAYDFGSFRKVVDLGGGHGALLRAILREYPGLSGMVADTEGVLEGAKSEIAREELDDRCETAVCNFFESVPAGGDCYLLKHIVHDWADEQASQLLRNIRNVMPSDGKLLLAEAVLDESAAPHPGKLLDIEMMAFVGGKERTEEQFRQLLLQSGFLLTRVVQTKSPLALVEAVPLMFERS